MRQVKLLQVQTEMAGTASNQVVYVIRVEWVDLGVRRQRMRLPGGGRNLALLG